MRTLFIIGFCLCLLMSCENKLKIRKEILSKANTDMDQIVNQAINSQTAGFGSLVLDNILTPAKKQKIIGDNLLPPFQKFINRTNDKDSLIRMNNDGSFRRKMIIQSTVGVASEEGLKLIAKFFY